MICNGNPSHILPIVAITPYLPFHLSPFLLRFYVLPRAPLWLSFSSPIFLISLPFGSSFLPFFVFNVQELTFRSFSVLHIFVLPLKFSFPSPSFSPLPPPRQSTMSRVKFQPETCKCIIPRQEARARWRACVPIAPSALRAKVVASPAKRASSSNRITYGTTFRQDRDNFRARVSQSLGSNDTVQTDTLLFPFY